MDFARLRKPHAVADDFGIEAVAAILVAQPFSDTVASFGASHVRLAGDVPQIAFGAGGIGHRAHLLLEGAFGGDAGGREPTDTGIILCATGNCGGKNDDAGQDDCGTNSPGCDSHSHLVAELQILYYTGAGVLDWLR